MTLSNVLGSEHRSAAGRDPFAGVDGMRVLDARSARVLALAARIRSASERQLRDVRSLLDGLDGVARRLSEQGGASAVLSPTSPGLNAQNVEGVGLAVSAPVLMAGVEPQVDDPWLSSRAQLLAAAGRPELLAQVAELLRALTSTLGPPVMIGSIGERLFADDRRSGRVARDGRLQVSASVRTLALLVGQGWLALELEAAVFAEVDWPLTSDPPIGEGAEAALDAASPECVLAALAWSAFSAPSSMPQLATGALLELLAFVEAAQGPSRALRSARVTAALLAASLHADDLADGENPSAAARDGSRLADPPQGQQPGRSDEGPTPAVSNESLGQLCLLMGDRAALPSPRQRRWTRLGLLVALLLCEFLEGEPAKGGELPAPVDYERVRLLARAHGQDWESASTITDHNGGVEHGWQRACLVALSLISGQRDHRGASQRYKSQHQPWLEHEEILKGLRFVCRELTFRPTEWEYQGLLEWRAHQPRRKRRVTETQRVPSAAAIRRRYSRHDDPSNAAMDEALASAEEADRDGREARR